MQGIYSDLWVFYNEVRGCSVWPITAEKKDLTGKWAMVTGGSDGIGMELAKMLAQAGCNIVITARPGKKGDDKGARLVQEIQKAGVKTGTDTLFWPMDAEKLSDVKDVADRWNQTHRPLDILVTNQGVGDAELALTSDGHERHYQISFLSHFYLWLLLLPALAKSKAPRIVGVTSCFHYFGREINWEKLDSLKQESWPPLVPLEPFLMKYGRSKLCVVMLIRELSIRLADQEKYRHIVLHAVHPGVVKTNIFRNHLKGEHLLRAAGALFMHSIGISVSQGAIALWKGCVSDDDERATRSGGYFNRAWRMPPRPEANDPAQRRKLWDMAMNSLPSDVKKIL